MRLRSIVAGALAAALMAVTTVTASALDVTSDNVVTDDWGHSYYIWGDLKFSYSAGGYYTSEGKCFIVQGVINPSATDIVIPDTINGIPVTGINGGVFSSSMCPAPIKSITIPVTVIDIWAQSEYVGLAPIKTLTDIYYQGTEKQYDEIYWIGAALGEDIKLSTPEDKGEYFGDNITVHFNSSGTAGSSDVGDINGDGVINALDAVSILRAIISGKQLDAKTADVNGDGRVNALDAAAILRIAVGL